ncbi:hypothetical protein H8356DRAFT_1754570 [Neocallimastix lanati (nom. inval.)]|nr:hypothetical protein H8356DRAFT_1754570 [Neocallimastix sp. JGI-2020a]
MDNISMKALDKFFKESSLFNDEKKEIKKNSICCKRCNNNKYIELRRLQIRRCDEEATIVYYCSNLLKYKMHKKNFKSSEQLVKSINSSNKSSTSRMDYYNRILSSSCSTDMIFQRMISTINFKEVVPLPKNNSMFRFVIKCFNNTNNVILGPLKISSGITLTDLPSLSIPMSHYHLNKNNFVQDNFIHRISENETEPMKKFIERLRFIDSRMQMLISDYIRHIDESSPIYYMLKKNNVKFNQNWIFTGIINKGNNNTEYINIRYFKDSFKGKKKIGTNVYCGDDYLDEMADLLSRDTFCYINGNIYPLIKVNYIIINERIVNNIPMVNFTCKAYFVDINFIPNSIHCSTKRI